jgi:hypothetical protein
MQTVQKLSLSNKPINFIPPEVCLAWNYLSDLEQYYPGFRYWFFEKVYPDFISGERNILIKKIDNKVCAVAILKRSLKESKICTFRVSENLKRKGIGTELMLQSLEWLDCSQPLITVNEEHAFEFDAFLQKFNFKKDLTLVGLYRPRRKEIIYNSEAS